MALTYSPILSGPGSQDHMEYQSVQGRVAGCERPRFTPERVARTHGTRYHSFPTRTSSCGSREPVLCFVTADSARLTTTYPMARQGGSGRYDAICGLVKRNREASGCTIPSICDRRSMRNPFAPNLVGKPGSKRSFLRISLYAPVHKLMQRTSRSKHSWLRASDRSRTKAVFIGNSCVHKIVLLPPQVLRAANMLRMCCQNCGGHAVTGSYGCSSGPPPFRRAPGALTVPRPTLLATCNSRRPERRPAAPRISRAANDSSKLRVLAGISCGSPGKTFF